MTNRGAAAAGALLIALAALTGCVGATDRYADIQRVAEIVRAELGPLSGSGPDPRVVFELGAPTTNLDTFHPRLTISEFTIDQPTLAAEIAYWRELDRVTDGAATGFAIGFPVWHTGDYERTIGFDIDRGLASAARVATFRTAAAVPDPSGAGTHWAVGFAPESFVLANQGRAPLSSRLAFPEQAVLDLWDRILIPLPGGVTDLQSEWAAPLPGASQFPESLILRLRFPDNPAAWDRLVEVSGAALDVAETVAVMGGGAGFGVYVSTSCDDDVKDSSRETDRSAELIAALGAEGERFGICDD